MISHEDTNEASSSSSFVVISSQVDSIQAFSVDHIPFLASMLSHTGVPLTIFHWFRSAEDISEDLCLHYQSVQAILRLLSYSSHLIEPAQSLF